MKKFIGIVKILVLLSFCTPSLPLQAQLTFPASTPESQGISSEAVLNFIERVENEIDAMHSIMILRHGKLISQGWWEPFNPETPHIMHSLSKSFTSTAIGFAVDEGLLSIYDPVISFFPDESPQSPSNNLNSMRVVDLLTMNTGHINPPRPDQEVENWVKHFLEQEVELKPGTHFKYNSMATYMLSAILNRITGQSLVEFLQPRLFEPLQIRTPEWDKCPMGIDVGGWGLHIVTEDIAKFGQLYLQKGNWNGRQLISESWVEMATSRQVSNGSNPDSDWDQGYGFQFWRCRNNCYRGDGAFGQFCIVIPEQDAVIAVTSASNNMGLVMQLIWDHLLPEFKENALPENPELNKKLESKTAKLRVKPVEGEAKSMFSRKVSAKPYILENNPAGIKSITLQLHGENPSVTFATDKGKQSIQIGYGEYVVSETREALPFSGNLRSKFACSGAWVSPEEYRLRIFLYEDTGRLNYTFRFTEESLEWNPGLEFSIFNPVETMLLRGQR